MYIYICMSVKVKKGPSRMSYHDEKGLEDEVEALNLDQQTLQ